MSIIDCEEENKENSANIDDERTQDLPLNNEDNFTDTFKLQQDDDVIMQNIQSPERAKEVVEEDNELIFYKKYD